MERVAGVMLGVEDIIYSLNGSHTTSISSLFAR